MTSASESRLDFGRILWFAGFLLLILAALLLRQLRLPLRLLVPLLLGLLLQLQ